MVIAFDTFFLARKFRNVGIYEYSKNLLTEFQNISAKDSSIAVRYFVSSSYSDEIIQTQVSKTRNAVETKLLRFHRLWRMGLINAAALRAGADVIFTPSPNILPWRVLPVAVTIHDAISQKLPSELVEGSTGLRAITYASAKLSRKIITDSLSSKRDLMEIYNIPSEKISVVYLGYDRETFNTASPDTATQAALLARFGITEPYIFHHGMVQFRKNVGRLIEAYIQLMARRKDFKYQLILAGAFGFGSEQILRIAQTTTRGRVIFVGSIPPPELALLLKGAALCVVPSLYEGFCLPMVEAMACGIPTVVSNASCLPEVSAGTLRYFDPLSTEQISSTIEEVLDSPEIQNGLIRRGLERASQFSWQRCARETLQVLAETRTTDYAVPVPCP